MAALDKLIHEPARLRIMASLAAPGSDAEVDFSFLRDQLGLTDGNLGSHLGKLEGAKYIRIRKTFVGRRPRTYVRLTRPGRRALEDHIAALKSIIETC